MNVKRLFEQVEMNQGPVTVSDTRKVSLYVIHGFLESLFCGPMFKNLHSKQRQKMNNTARLKKRLHVKI